jgi:hypothetical protein
MARLLVQAVTGEWTSGDMVYTLLVDVSVSRADNGSPVTGLVASNFRVASSIGLVEDFKVASVSEWNWEPGGLEPAGCYELDIVLSPTAKFEKGGDYEFGIQARTFDNHRPPNVIDQGQTIIELISRGI